MAKTNVSPDVEVLRCRHGVTSAVLFVHGFTGNAKTTWDTFIRTLQEDKRLNDWDVYSLGYSSRFAVDVPIWTTDPQLKVCAIGLRTKLTHPPLEDYGAFAVVAHSMGGLVVQRAMLDSIELRTKVSHIVLYGTPSGGLRKARFGSLFKRQLADMAEDGEFIRDLRLDWKSQFGRGMPFELKVVAGSDDGFVPAESSLMVFPDRQCEVVPGNHIEIVHPTTVQHPSYEVLFKMLSGSGVLRTAAESARLAVETQKFRSAVGTLLPEARRLDSEAIVTLSLALETLGRRAEAMRVVKNHVDAGRATLDVIGVLAGRLKRRWLFSRNVADYERSLELYQSSLQNAVEAGKVEQAYYLGINVAFLKLIRSPEHLSVGNNVREAASIALNLATQAPQTSWSLATIGDASLMLGDLKKGLVAYRRAKAAASTVRDQHSMYSQALQIAIRLYGDEGQSEIQAIFEGLDDR